MSRCGEIYGTDSISNIVYRGMICCMRLAHWLLLAGMTGILIGCEASAGEMANATKDEVSVCTSVPQADQALTSTPRHTLIFIDVSSSADLDGLRAEYEPLLEKVVPETMVPRSSRFELFTIHSTTTGRADHKLFEQFVPPPTKKDFDLDQIGACNAYVAQVKQEINKVFNESKAFVQEIAIPKANTTGSDLWGVLDVATAAFEQGPENAERSIYILSDLMECTRGRRCFENKPPRDRVEAEAWAKEDAEQLERHIRINREVLRTAIFHLMQGKAGFNEKAKNMPYYWRTLLGELGVPDTQIRVN